MVTAMVTAFMQGLSRSTAAAIDLLVNAFGGNRFANWPTCGSKSAADSQGGELGSQLLNLLLLSQDERPGTGWPRQPVRFGNPSGWGAHRIQSLPEMQTGIRLPSRVQQG
jgi:hypothetical protein